MIKKKYLERTQELISDHLTLKINQKRKKRESREEEDGDTDRSSNQQNTENSDDNSGEDEEDQVINLNDKQDLDLMKKLQEVVRAYQILSNQKDREDYLKTIRLRSWASQYMNTHAAEKDGFIYPFLLFSV